MFSFLRAPKPSPEAVKMSQTVSDMARAITNRRRQLMEDTCRGVAAGGFCLENGHHVQIVTQNGCGCEGLHLLPFGVAFWTCVEHDPDMGEHTLSVFYGWGQTCKHGKTLPLPGPDSHDILPKGALS